MKVIAPKRCNEYLTDGKEYEAFDIYQDMFTITTDVGMKAKCLLKGCNHLNGGDWIIDTEKTKKKYHVLFIREGENISTGITYHSETVTGALRKFFSENKNALFLSVSSEDLFKLKY